MRASIVLRVLMAPMLLLAGTVVTGSPVRAAPAYDVTELGNLVGTGDGQFDTLTRISPSANNDDGVALVNSVAGDGTFWAVPFTSTDGRVKRLGKEKAFSFATEINNVGDVAGYSTALDDTNFTQITPLVWRETKQTELDTPFGVGQAVALNDDGVIVGMAQIDESGTRHAVRWDDGEMTDLGTIDDGTSIASDVNQDSVIIGGVTFPDRPDRVPFMIEDGEMTELESPEGLFGIAFEINDEGVIVGMGMNPENQLHALRWENGKVERLPELVDGGVSNALDSNNAGLVVGWASNVEGDASYSAVLWDGDDVYDLNDLIPEHPDYTLSSGQAINNSGQILVVATSADGSTRGLLLVPIKGAERQAQMSSLHHNVAILRNDN